MNAFEDNQVCPNPDGQRFNSDRIKKMKFHQLKDSEVIWFSFYGIVNFYVIENFSISYELNYNCHLQNGFILYFTTTCGKNNDFSTTEGECHIKWKLVQTYSLIWTRELSLIQSKY